MTDSQFIDAALRNWNINLDRATKFFEGLSEEGLQAEVAPGRNRLIYLWGHLAAVNDALIPLLDFGRRLHPELDDVFLKNADRAVENPFSVEDVRHIWRKTNEVLQAGFAELSPAEWLQRHTSVSEEDFQKEPHRNRYNVLLGRTGHIAYHLGQVMLTREAD
ncbi:MAG: DinB family protein [Acidobacteria bacterium]|nr:DinB family protein [Acidobacteriota bacterium]